MTMLGDNDRQVDVVREACEHAADGVEATPGCADDDEVVQN